MKIHGHKENEMSWVNALSKHNQPPADLEKHLAEASASASHADELKGALEDTSQIVFGLPKDNVPQQKAITDASKKAMDDAMRQKQASDVQSIKNKLSAHGVDPVSLGVVSRSEWNAIADANRAEALAKKAALAAEEAARNQWQQRASEELENPRRHSAEYDPATTREGKVAPTTSARDDSAPHNPNVPLNAVSMADLDRLDRLSEKGTRHEELVSKSRESAKAREEKARDWRQEEIPEDVVPMKSSSVIRAGGKDRDEGRYHAPSNQVSMLDDISGGSPEEIQKKLSSLFTTKIPDKKQETREANEQRRAEIQGPVKDHDRSWEKVEKPTSTKDISERLAELWMPQGGDNQE